MADNQLSRYGGIARKYPFVTGKIFFLLSSSEAKLPGFNSAYPVDSGGVPRVYTSWASVIAATTAGNFDLIYVSPNFTTAATAGQLLSLETNGVSVFFLGRTNDDGTFFTKRTTATLPQGVSAAIATVTGKLKLISVIGEVTTAIQNQANATKLQAVSTTPSATIDLCATTSIANAAVGTQLSITGTAATGLVVSAGAGLFQATPIIILPGTINLSCAASNTGSVKWHFQYQPIDPGAMIVPA